jgi:hypothetical protein
MNFLFTFYAKKKISFGVSAQQQPAKVSAGFSLAVF